MSSQTVRNTHQGGLSSQSETLAWVVCPVTVRNTHQDGLSSQTVRNTHQGANTKRFKRKLIYFNTDRQYAHFQGNLLYKPQNDTLQINSPGWFVQSQSKTLARVVCPVKHSTGWFVQSQSETLIRVVCPVTVRNTGQGGLSSQTVRNTHQSGLFSQTETLNRVVCPVKQKHSPGWFVQSVKNTHQVGLSSQPVRNTHQGGFSS